MIPDKLERFNSMFLISAFPWPPATTDLLGPFNWFQFLLIPSFPVEPWWLKCSLALAPFIFKNPRIPPVYSQNHVLSAHHPGCKTHAKCQGSETLRGTSLDASPYPRFPTITGTQFKSLCFGECPLTLLGLTGVCLCWPSLMHRFCVVAFLPLQVDVCSGI